MFYMFVESFDISRLLLNPSFVYVMSLKHFLFAFKICWINNAVEYDNTSAYETRSCDAGNLSENCDKLQKIKFFRLKQ